MNDDLWVVEMHGHQPLEPDGLVEVGQQAVKSFLRSYILYRSLIIIGYELFKQRQPLPRIALSVRKKGCT